MQRQIIFLKIGIILFFLFCLWIPAFATTDLYSFPTSQQHQQFAQLLTKFRCLVCQNESLADSHAPLALDLKSQIYTMVQRGKTDPEITNYLVTRYGDFILFEPPYVRRTYLLWLAPFIFLFLGFFILWRMVRKKN